MKASDNPFPKVILNEAATDGSDFTNPAADYRVLFLGEDGALHLKDSAGAVTDIGGSVAEITSIPTSETDTNLVLAPDGAGGVEFRAEAGGAAVVPTVVQQVSAYVDSSTTNALTVAAPTKALIAIVMSEARGATSITQTNVTWTQRYTASSSSMYVEMWTGAITGSAGTSCTANFASATKSKFTMVEIDTTALTAVGTAATSTAGALTLTGETAGALVVYAETSFNGNTSYTVSTMPMAPINWGESCTAGLVFYAKPRVAVNVIQSAGATRFGAIMRIS